MVGMQQFNLRWNNYTSNILQVFSEHLSSESLVDVTLSCQGRFIRAHKIILSACSPYFQEVFANHTDKHPVIILKGIKYEDLQSMIKFMYNGEIRVQEAQLDDLLAAAELLQVKGLSNVRSKYERGEITSLNPPAKPTTAKSADSGMAKKDLPTHSLKATVALFTPTATTTRAPNTTTTRSNRANTPGKDAIIPVTVTKSDTMTLIPASTFHAANLAAGTAPSVRPALAIATLVPSNTIIPLRDGNNWIRSSATGATNNFTLPTSASSAITVSTITRDPAIGASLISSTSTTPSLDTPIITCVTGNFVDPNDNEPPVNEIAISNADNVPIGHLTRLVPIAPAAGIPAIEKKPAAEGQAPRIRKRRKMSHIVNELAKETVFASNGTVLLEPDDAVGKNRTKTSQSSTSLLTQRSSTSAELEEITVKKMRVKIQTKTPQESLLIKESERKSSKIPRPPNAFMIFANEWRRKLAVEFPKENNKKISVRLGIMWKGLGVNAKESYYKLARKADEEHKLRYPGYYYSPKEARIRKTLKHHPNKRPTTKSLASSKDADELQMLEAFINGEDQEIVQFTDSSDYDDDDYEDVEEEQEQEQEEEDDEEDYDDDVILDEYTDDEDDPRDQNSQSSTKRKDPNASSSSKVNTSKT